LIDKFIRVFGAEKIDRLLGDREFIGETWFAYLDTHNIKFWSIHLSRDTVSPQLLTAMA
jgi:hypothetical protein